MNLFDLNGWVYLTIAGLLWLLGMWLDDYLQDDK